MASNGRILLAEDDFLTALHIRETLEAAGYSVMGHCRSGAEAFSRLREADVDLVLMDINLEGDIDGIQAASMIWSQLAVPVVYLTAYADEKTIDRATATEPFGYLVKPLETGELERTVHFAIYKGRMERELRDRERRLRTIYDFSALGIFEVTPAGDLQKLNPALAHMLGFDSAAKAMDAFRGSRYHGFVDANEGVRLIREVCDSDSPRRYELELCRRDKTVIICRTVAHAVRHSSGEVDFIYGFVDDITSQREAEQQAELQKQQLIQADRLASLGTLAAGIAHEINNPNQSIRFAASALQPVFEALLPLADRELAAGREIPVGHTSFQALRPEIGESLTGILESSRRIESIVSELKEFARSDTRDASLRVLNINMMINSAITLCRNYIKRATDHFAADLDTDLPRVIGNPQRLEQVIVNLIQNACHALTDRSGKISVVSRRESDDEIAITVVDTGRGIPQDEISHVTDPFYTTRRDIGGTGLGLSISSTIIRDHGGRLEFESKPRKGTSAKVVLPVFRGGSAR